ncbi:glucose-6-phosphate isomerase [Candidatus Micrarchaeota archaeon]|nr:glucose-6-phosphate isomerase [Candidatus Micrarchaeota archaeon]
MEFQNPGLLTELSADLKLSIEGQVLEPDVRTVKQMRPVLAGAVNLMDSQGLYQMYRESCRPQDRDAFAKRSLRYDITVVPPVMLGEEYNKTLGHYHPYSIRPPLSYPELYEVLHGTAHYLLQKRKATPTGTLEIERCFLVETRAGEKAIMPPDYGHVTINAGFEPVVMDNLVERTFKSVYEPYVQRHGAAYYLLRQDGRAVERPNPAFVDLPKLEKMRAPQFNRLVSAKLADFLDGGFNYELFLKNPDSFGFLVDPRDIVLKE